MARVVAAHLISTTSPIITFHLIPLANDGRDRTMHPMATNITIRTGNIEDLEAVYQLNKHTFSECWSRTSLFSALESDYDLLLCEYDGILAGYMLSLNILDETQIMQIAVSKNHRRQGLATRMTEAFIASSSNITTITLEVRLSNHAAKACYAHLGFEEVGYRKNYYAPDANNMREDAVLMTKNIGAYSAKHG